MKIILIIVAILLGALIFISSRTADKVLSGDDLAAVLAYSEPIADNLFAGFAANDYTAFSRDFDPDMQETIPDDLFVGWKLNLDDKLGSYISHQVDQVTQSGEFHVVVYQVEFEKDDQAKIGVIFHIAEPHAISHMWIDSDVL